LCLLVRVNLRLVRERLVRVDREPAGCGVADASDIVVDDLVVVALVRDRGLVRRVEAKVVRDVVVDDLDVGGRHRRREVRLEVRQIHADVVADQRVLHDLQVGRQRTGLAVRTQSVPWAADHDDSARCRAVARIPDERVAAHRIPRDGPAGAVADLNPVHRDEIHVPVARDLVVRDVHLNARPVDHDPALLVPEDLVARDRAGHHAGVEEAPVVDGRPVLGAVVRNLADVVDRAVDDVDLDHAVVAVDENPEVVRTEDVRVLDDARRSCRVVHADVATARVEYALHRARRVDLGGRHVDAVAEEPRRSAVGRERRLREQQCRHYHECRCDRPLHSHPPS